MPTSDGVVYIDILERTNGLRMAASVGARDDYYSTAIGKAIAAFWGSDELALFLQRARLEAKTQRTLVEPRALERDLARTRARGYAVDDEENEVGARCVGAPVFDRHGRAIAAISASGPASRLAPSRIEEVAELVTATAREISAGLGHLLSGEEKPPRPGQDG